MADDVGSPRFVLYGIQLEPLPESIICNNHQLLPQLSPSLSAQVFTLTTITFKHLYDLFSPGP